MKKLVIMSIIIIIIIIGAILVLYNTSKKQNIYRNPDVGILNRYFTSTENDIYKMLAGEESFQRLKKTTDIIRIQFNKTQQITVKVWTNKISIYEAKEIIINYNKDCDIIPYKSMVLIDDEETSISPIALNIDIDELLNNL